MIAFYSNLIVLEAGTISTMVKGISIVLDVGKLGLVLMIPVEGYSEYEVDTEFSPHLLPKYSQGTDPNASPAILKGSMLPRHRILFELVNKEPLPRSPQRHKVVGHD